MTKYGPYFADRSLWIKRILRCVSNGVAATWIDYRDICTRKRVPFAEAVAEWCFTVVISEPVDHMSLYNLSESALHPSNT